MTMDEKLDEICLHWSQKIFGGDKKLVSSTFPLNLFREISDSGREYIENKSSYKILLPDR